MNNENNGHFSSGFLIGVIVGALLVFLFGTKSGKRIVKILSEEGLEGIQNLMEEYEEGELEEEFEEESPKAIERLKTSTKEPEVKQKMEETTLDTNSHTNGVAESSPKKRFFKRIRR